MQRLHPKNLKNTPPAMHQLSCQTWLGRLPQPDKSQFHAAVVSQEHHQHLNEGPLLPQVCTSLPLSSNPLMSATLQHVASPMASIVGLVSVICCTHGHLVLHLRRSHVLQQLKRQLVSSDLLCCNSARKPMHLNMCYMRCACVRPINRLFDGQTW